MVKRSIHKHLMLIFFSEEVTLRELEDLTDEVNHMSRKNGELYVVAIVQTGCNFPRHIPDLIQALQLMNRSAKRIKRLYGLRFHPIISFLGEVVTQTFRIRSNTIEAKTVTELLQIIERDSEKYPQLKASLENWERIKREIVLNAPADS